MASRACSAVHYYRYHTILTVVRAPRVLPSPSDPTKCSSSKCFQRWFFFSKQTFSLHKNHRICVQWTDGSSHMAFCWWISVSFYPCEIELRKGGTQSTHQLSHISSPNQLISWLGPEQTSYRCENFYKLSVLRRTVNQDWEVCVEIPTDHFQTNIYIFLSCLIRDDVIVSTDWLSTANNHDDRKHFIFL